VAVCKGQIWIAVCSEVFSERNREENFLQIFSERNPEENFLQIFSERNREENFLQIFSERNREENFLQIHANNQLDALFSCIYLFHLSTCFEHHCAHHQEIEMY
jgi:hypothetical protein